MKSTKQLARELGLLRKRSSSDSDARWKRLKAKCQIFAYLVVIDFESTCWKNTKNTPQEIIEFPAVLLNTATGEIEDEYHSYVMPQEHPTLSEFCKQFTGISQEKVDDGVPLNICLSKFTRWLNRLSEKKKIEFNRGDDESLLCTFATWSDWDLGVCLFYECRRKQIRMPVQLNSWLDLRATYKKFYERKPNGLNGALKDLGIEFEGREHSGLDDARNTAKLAWRMIKDGCIMTITKSLDVHIKTALKTTGTFKSCIEAKKQKTLKDAQLIGKTSRATSSTASNASVMAFTGIKRPVVSEKPHTKDISVCKPPTESSSGGGASEEGGTSGKVTGRGEDVDRNNLLKNCSGGDEFAQDSEESEMDLILNSCGIETDVLELGMYENDEDDEGICKEKQDTLKSVNQDVENCDRGQSNYSSESVSDNCCGKKEVSGSKSWSPSGQPENPLVKKESFSRSKSKTVTVTPMTGKKIVPRGNFQIHSDCGGVPTPKVSATSSVLKDKKNICQESKVDEKGKSSNSNSLCSVNSRFKTPTNRLIPDSMNSRFKTFSTGNRVNGSSNMKVTPPLCKCGRRSKRRVAQTPGPNQGRSFFSCPHGNSSKNKGCGYFQWESVYTQRRSPQVHGFASPFTYAKPQTNMASPQFGSVTQKLSFTCATGTESTQRTLGVRVGPKANNRI